MNSKSRIQMKRPSLSIIKSKVPTNHIPMYDLVKLHIKPQNLSLPMSLHTPPEWVIVTKSPEKWYTTYCQGPLGVPKYTFDQI